MAGLNRVPASSGTGHGKLLLFGEHAILYGHPAVGLGLPASLTVRLESGPVAAGLRVDCQPGWQCAVLAATDRIAASLGLARPTGRLCIDSQLPSGSGFGSSAALCVALAVCLAGLPAGQPLSQADYRRLWQAAHCGERQFHGQPSGIDTALALYGGCLAFQPVSGDLPTLTRLPSAGLPLISGSLPRLANAKASIQRLRQRMDQADPVVVVAMTEAGHCAEQAIALLAADPVDPVRNQRHHQLGQLANQAQAALRRLDLSTPPLERLLTVGLEAGACGGKLSGAGAGGAFWLICPDTVIRASVLAALRQVAAALSLPDGGGLSLTGD